jgi:hypothetical protein
VLRKIFGTNRERVRGEWRELHSGGGAQCFALLKKYSRDQINKSEIGGTCITYGERRDVYRVLLGKREGMRPFGRLRHILEDNTKVDLNKPGRMAWTGLIWLL